MPQPYILLIGGPVAHWGWNPVVFQYNPWETGRRSKTEVQRLKEHTFASRAFNIRGLPAQTGTCTTSLVSWNVCCSLLSDRLLILVYALTCESGRWWFKDIWRAISLYSLGICRHIVQVSRRWVQWSASSHFGAAWRSLDQIGQASIQWNSVCEQLFVMGPIVLLSAVVPRICRGF